MDRAQLRDAVHTQKFFFRKDVFPSGVPSPLSSPPRSPHGSGSSSPVDPTGENGLPRPKSRKLQNCFAVPPEPKEDHTFGPVEEEYEEYTLDELFNGKVSLKSHWWGDQRSLGMWFGTGGYVPRFAWLGVLVPRDAGCGREGVDEDT